VRKTIASDCFNGMAGSKGVKLDSNRERCIQVMSSQA
jgi:hypothetical protein